MKQPNKETTNQPTNQTSKYLQENKPQLYIKIWLCKNIYIDLKATRKVSGFCASSAGKESACNTGDPSSIPRLGRSPGVGIGYPLQYSWASLVAQLVKNLPAKQEMWVQFLGWEDPLEEHMATHSSVLAWRIPMDRGAWWATFGVAKSRTQLSDSAEHREVSGEQAENTIRLKGCGQRADAASWTSPTPGAAREIKGLSKAALPAPLLRLPLAGWQW